MKPIIEMCIYYRHAPRCQKSNIQSLRLWMTNIALSVIHVEREKAETAL